jgi:putative thioredoxin
VATNEPISPASLRGAVDLSALVGPRPARATGAVDPKDRSTTDATFTDVLDRSKTVPVIVEFYGQGIAPVLGSLIDQYAGRLSHAVVDATANPQLVEAFQVQQVPTVAGVIGGRPVQLYVGDYPEAEVRQVFDQVLELAKEQGVVGTLPAAESDAPPAPVEEPLPPHHQEAFDAISSGDYATAVAEYKTAIAQNPRDALAIAGLAQVSLLLRLDGSSAEGIRAAAESGSLESQLELADLSVSLGDATAAFDLLLGLFPAQDPAGKNTIRTRLLDYFEILGSDDPLVAASRRRLAGLLY